MLVDAADRDIWNRFVAQAPLGDVLQCWEWGELKSRTGWEPLHFAAPGEGGLAAAALVLKRALPRTGRSLMYCPRGPVTRDGSTTGLAELVGEIRQHARRSGAIALIIDPAMPLGADGWEKALRDLGFRPPGEHAAGFGATQPRAVMKVDISPEPEDLLASFHSKWRYNIRYAERKGVRVRSDCSREDVDVFYEILRVTAERDGFGVRSRGYFQAMWDLVIEQGLGRLFMGYAGEEPVCGAICFALGNQAWYVYGASSNEHRELMPNHLMQWQMMLWAKSRGCTVYDMRGVSPEVDGEPIVPHLAGLNRFKAGFGAEYVEYLGDWTQVFSPTWYFLFQRVLPLARKALGRGAREAGD